MGAQAIELDVHSCKSGELLVIHDDMVDRTTNGSGRVKELDLKTLKTFDAGKGEHIPLLSDVFDVVNKKAVIDIDIKDADATKAVAELINYYVKSKQWTYDNFVVSSFDREIIRKFHELCPHVKTGVIFEEPIDYITIVQKVYAHYAIIDYKFITQKLINDAHAKGIIMWAYTVNDKHIMKKLMNVKIDGIITDFPNIKQL